MTINNDGGIKKIIPDDGKYIKNLKTGEIYDGRMIYPSIFLLDTDFTEITEEEYQEYRNASEDDYLQALGELGLNNE